MENIIEVEGLYKIFGDNPDEAMKMLQDGKDKKEILHETGCTVGINNAPVSR